MSDPTVKFCLDHPQKLLQIFQVSGKVGRFGLVKQGHLPNFSPICLFLRGTFKIVIDIAKKKVQTFLNSSMFRGVLWTPSYINSPWWKVIIITFFFFFKPSLINSKIVVFSLFHLPFNDIKGTSNLFILKATKKNEKNYKNDLQRDIEDNYNDLNSGCES